MKPNPQYGLRIAKAFGLALFALLALSAGDAAAQTPEGTEIENISTVTFVDSNGNSYDAQADVTIIVGFSGGLEVTAADPDEVTPAAPSTDNTDVVFTITNNGNGDDNVEVGVVYAQDDVLTQAAVRYQINGAGPEYTLALLNDQLETLDIGAGSSITINLVYDVNTGTGGLTQSVELTATSVRDPGLSDAADLTDDAIMYISPPLTGDVDVTIDGGEAEEEVERLRSNTGDTNVIYEAIFNVDNQRTGTDVFDLVVTTDAGQDVVTIVDVNGEAGTESEVELESDEATDITVRYTVRDDADVGDVETLTLTVTSQADAAATGSAAHQVTVIEPDLGITKVALRDDGVGGPDEDAEIDHEAGDRVAPGETVWYKIEVTNNGTAEAVSVEVEDELPATLEYLGFQADAVGWTITHDGSGAGGTVTAELTGSLAIGASRHFFIEVTIP